MTNLSIAEREAYRSTLETMSESAWQEFAESRFFHFEGGDLSPEHPAVLKNEETLKALALVNHALVGIEPQRFEEPFWLSAAIDVLRQSKGPWKRGMPLEKIVLFAQRNRRMQESLLADAQAQILIDHPEYHGPVEGEEFAKALATGRVGLKAPLGDVIILEPRQSASAE